jgi:CobQ-like glutamine amidotransferase family enzyme
VSEPRTLRVCALYPDLMNIYADRGNLLMLRRRCEWRGIGFELTGVGIGDPLDPDGPDLYYIGGGQDRDQELCADDLFEHKREALVAAAEDGAATSCSATPINWRTRSSRGSACSISARSEPRDRA